MKLNIRQMFMHAVAVFFATACVAEMNEAPQGGQTDIFLTIDIEDAPATRAISDGTSVDKLTYAVMTAEGEFVSRSEKTFPSGVPASGEVKMTVSLAGGVSYKLVCWAQSSLCDAYSLSDDMVLSVNYAGAANDELRDAFFGVSDVFTLSDRTASVTLKRPFAQLNAGTHVFDWEYVTGFHDFDVRTSTARVRGVADKLNLLDGTVSGSVDAQFTPSALPAQMLRTDVDENGNDEEYAYLFMSYILAAEESSYHSVDIHFLDADGQTVMFEDPGLNNVELKRNHRTDFVGQVLSDNGVLNQREYLPSVRIYHNVSEDSVISDIVYDMSGHDAVRFASESGQKMTLNNIYITGDIWTIELGEYRGSSYVNYNNELNNVVLKDLVCTSCIECHEWYFSPAVIAYGNTVANNCSMTGATTVCEPVTDKHGVVHEVIPVDFGVRNESDAVINGGTYGTVFAWTHAVVDIHGATINTLYCGTCDSTKHSWMTIHSGTTIDKVICCEPRCPYGGKEYSTTMTIKKGAVIGSLQLVSTDVEFLIIEDGAKVGKITCEGVEYTYKELREAMGL
jgi:hypothetical protein